MCLCFRSLYDAKWSSKTLGERDRRTARKDDRKSHLYVVYLLEATLSLDFCLTLSER